MAHEIDNKSQIPFTLKEELELLFTDKFIEKGASKSKKENKTILWVDDRPENNVYERNILEGMGLEIITALSTEQALMWIKHNDVAIIISDMDRKEGPREGYVLLDKLRSEGNNTPFLIYAGSNAPEYVKETYVRGGQGHTNNPEGLFDMVTSILLDEPTYNHKSSMNYADFF